MKKLLGIVVIGFYRITRTITRTLEIKQVSGVSMFE